MTPDQFRRIALSMSGAIEAAHMNHPDFRANGRVFATISEDVRRGMVTLTPEQQEAFMRDHPGAFEPASGAWGRQGCTMVKLASTDEETVGEAMTLAWQNSARAMKKKPSAKRSAKASTPPQRRRAAK